MHGRLSCIIVTLLFLSACKTEFHADAYSSDLFLTKNVPTPAEMAVEIPSCTGDNVEKYKTQTLSLFTPDSNAKIVGCERKNMKSMLVVSLDAEISSETSNADIILFRQSYPDTEVDGKAFEIRGIKPTLAPNFLQRVNLLMKQNMQSLDYDDITVKLTLNNDEREDVLVSASYVWVNGEPKETYRRQKLERRKKLDIKFSNVVSDLILHGAMPPVVFVGRQK